MVFLDNITLGKKIFLHGFCGSIALIYSISFLLSFFVIEFTESEGYLLNYGCFGIFNAICNRSEGDLFFLASSYVSVFILPPFILYLALVTKPLTYRTVARNIAYAKEKLKLVASLIFINSLICFLIIFPWLGIEDAGEFSGFYTFEGHFAFYVKYIVPIYFYISLIFGAKS